jgi:hypothetical protein
VPEFEIGEKIFGVVSVGGHQARKLIFAALSNPPLE